MLMGATDGGRDRITMNIRIINLTTRRGFAEKTLDLFRNHEHVHAIVDAKPDADGRYRDISLRVTEEFADFVVAYARDEIPEVDDITLN
jgi:hypothetical protein